MTTKIDRRIIRTRQLLRGALLALIRERGFDLITVQDITERAGLNRATFYLHFADKNDLLRQIVSETLDEISSLRPPLNPNPTGEFDSERMRVFFVSLFEHVIANTEFYRVMFSSGSIASFSNEVYESIFRVGIRWMTRSGVKSWRIPPDVIMSTLSGAYVGIVRWMLNQPIPPTAETTAGRFMELVMPGIIGAINP